MIRPVNIIVACAVETQAIGQDGKMPWHLPVDLKYFKARTENQVVIMGRKTYESIGKPLPNRINIVITSNVFSAAVSCVKSYDEALKIAETYKDKEVFVIGGGQVYKEAIKGPVDYLYITWVGYKNDGLIDGDTFFPDFDNNKYDLIDVHQDFSDEEFDLTFTTRKWKL